MSFSSLKKVFLFIFLLLFITGCKKKETVLFYNRDFYTIYPEKEKNYQLVKKDLYRKFFKVEETGLKNFAFLAFEVKKFVSKKPDIIFLENFLLSLFLENPENSIIPEIKILTYDLDREIKIDSKAVIFNISFDKNIFSNKTISLLNKVSDKKNLSDILILVNYKNSICRDFIDSIKKKYSPEIFEINNETDYNQAKEKINKKDIKAVLFFSANFNKLILENDILPSKNKIYIEVLTDYGKDALKSNYNISIKWDELISIALCSSSYKNFIEKNPDIFLEENKTSSNVFTFTPNLKNFVNIEKNN